MHARAAAIGLVGRARALAGGRTLLLPAGLVLLFLLVLPLLEVARHAALAEGTVHWAFARELLVASLVVGLASTAATLALALPVAYVLARHEFPGRRVLLALLTVPFVMPTVVAAMAVLAWVGPRGLLGAHVGGLPPFALVVFAHAFFNSALVVRLVGAAWAHTDPRLVDAARALGATRLQAFRRVELPIVLPAIGVAGLLSFLFSFTSFGPVLVLGGPEWSTLEVGIFLETRAGAWRSAAVLSLVQLAVTALAATAYSLLARRAAARTDPASEALARRPLDRASAPLAFLAGALAVVLVLGPLAALAERAFRVPSGHGFGNFLALGRLEFGTFLYVTPAEAAGNSALFAVLAMLVAVPAGALAAVALARAKGVLGDVLLTLPLGASAVTLGVGYLLFFDAPVDLRATALLVVFSHALLATPFALRAVLATALTVPPRFAEAARVLGAGRVRAFVRAELPLLWPAVVVAAVFALAVSLGEFAAASVLVRPEHTTLPVLLYRTLGRPGEMRLGQAYALALLLASLATSLFVLVERLRPRVVGEY